MAHKEMAKGICSVGMFVMQAFGAHYTSHARSFGRCIPTVMVSFFLWSELTGDHVHAQDFSYDQQGRLVTDAQNHLTKIEWNNDGKITHVVTDNADVEFMYDITGRRVKKLVKPKNGNGPLPQSSWQYTYYAYDALGQEIARYHRVYEHEHQQFAEIFSLTENPFNGGTKKYSQGKSLAHANFTATDGPSFENLSYTGRIVPAATQNEIETIKGEKYYELHDVANTVSGVITDRKKETAAELLFAQDYYPYGMVHPSRRFQHEKYTKGFVGKEADEEVAGAHLTYDFGARLLDPRIARWWSIDNLHAKTPGLSPYLYAENSPVRLIDPDGNEAMFVAAYSKDRKSGTLTISADIVVSNASVTFIKNYRKVLAYYYTPKKWIDYRNGAVWTIRFDLKVLSDADAFYLYYDAASKKYTRTFANTPWVNVCNGRSNTEEFFISREIDTDKNYANYSSTTAQMLVHETGHYLGLSDRYIEQISIENNAKHTAQSLQEAEEYPDDFMNSGFFFSATHVENWMLWILSRQHDPAVDKVVANLTDANNLDQENGKLKGPYLTVPYLRNRSAYLSIKKGEELRINRQKDERFPASPPYQTISKMQETR